MTEDSAMAALANFKQALRDLERDAAELCRMRDEDAKGAKEWEERAMLAVKNGRDAIAREALVQFQQRADAVARIEAELLVCESMLAEYQRSLAELERLHTE